MTTTGRQATATARGPPEVNTLAWVRARSGLLFTRRFDRHCSGRPELGDGIAGGQELHGDHPVVLQLGQFAEDIPVVDLAGSGLMAAGDVGDVNQSYVFDVLFQFFDEITLGNLFVEKIVEELHLGMSDRFYDLESTADRGKEVVRIFFRINVLEQQAYRLAFDALPFEPLTPRFHPSHP